MTTLKTQLIRLGEQVSHLQPNLRSIIDHLESRKKQAAAQFQLKEISNEQVRREDKDLVEQEQGLAEYVDSIVLYEVDVNGWVVNPLLVWHDDVHLCVGVYEGAEMRRSEEFAPEEAAVKLVNEIEKL